MQTSSLNLSLCISYNFSYSPTPNADIYQTIIKLDTGFCHPKQHSSVKTGTARATASSQ